MALLFPPPFRRMAHPTVGDSGQVGAAVARVRPYSSSRKLVTVRGAAGSVVFFLTAMAVPPPVPSSPSSRAAALVLRSDS